QNYIRHLSYMLNTSSYEIFNERSTKTNISNNDYINIELDDKMLSEKDKGVLSSENGLLNDNDMFTENDVLSKDDLLNKDNMIREDLDREVVDKLLSNKKMAYIN
ncbi:12458_t:CDS:2, partial [Cetraspora pellucida]